MDHEEGARSCPGADALGQKPALCVLAARICAALGDGGLPARPRVSGSPSHRCHSCSPPRHVAASMALQPVEPCVGFPGVQGEQQHPAWMHARRGARTGVLRAGFGQCPLESSTCCREGEASEHPAPLGMGTKLPDPSRTLKMPKPPCTDRRAGLLVPCAPAHLFSLLISGGVEIIT